MSRGRYARGSDIEDASTGRHAVYEGGALLASGRERAVRLEPRARAPRRRRPWIASGAGGARRSHLARGARLAVRRSPGRPTRGLPYPEARSEFFGPSNRPAPAPMSPTPSARILREFRERVAPATFNAQHPGSFSYFTPPPLPMSIAGEVLAQWIHQGRGRVARGAGRRVRRGGGHRMAPRARRLAGRRLGRPHVGRRDGEHHGAHGRARRLAAEAPRVTRGHRADAQLEGVRVYAGDQAHFSIARALDCWGSRRRRSRIAPDRRAVPAAARPPCRGRRARGSRRRPHAARDRRRGRLHEHRIGRRRAGPRGASRTASRCGSTSTPPTAGRRDCPRATRTASPGLERADSVTVDPAQMVLPGLRHRRAARAPPRGPARHLPSLARVLPLEPPRGRAAAVVPATRWRERGACAR